MDTWRHLSAGENKLIESGALGAGGAARFEGALLLANNLGVTVPGTTERGAVGDGAQVVGVV